MIKCLLVWDSGGGLFSAQAGLHNQADHDVVEGMGFQCLNWTSLPRNLQSTLTGKKITKRRV